MCSRGSQLMQGSSIRLVRHKIWVKNKTIENWELKPISKFTILCRICLCFLMVMSISAREVCSSPSKVHFGEASMF
jgi:hypothetical protein